MKHLTLTSIAVSAVLAVLLLLSSCGTVNSITGGLADEAYVTIVSDNSKITNKPVLVSINNQEPTEVKVIRTKDSMSKKAHFILKPGTYSISVRDKKEGKELYSGKVFLSTRKTKFIELR